VAKSDELERERERGTEAKKESPRLEDKIKNFTTAFGSFSLIDILPPTLYCGGTYYVSTNDEAIIEKIGENRMD
jgi:hypothetical protein